MSSRFLKSQIFSESDQEIWKENFDNLGYIYIRAGDELEDCTSHVYKNNHREFVGLGNDDNLEVESEAPDYDWETGLYKNI